MIRWCAYCQKFLGEAEPYDDYLFTHGVCPPCKQRMAAGTSEDKHQLSTLVRFQKRLWGIALSGDVQAAIELLDQALTLGVRPIDFLLGILGPLLREVGRLGDRGQLELIDQRQVHAFCRDLVETVRSRTSRSAADDILLVTVPGNEHTLGMHLMELWLQGEGFQARALSPGVGPEAIVELVRRHAPKVVGFSISMTEQVPVVREAVAAVCRDIDYPPLLLVGGYPVKLGLVKAKEVPRASLVSDEAKLFISLKAHLSTGFLYDLLKKAPQNVPRGGPGMTASKRNNVKVFGKGSQAMVFAHGFGCDQSMWRFMTPAFENDYKIVLFDHVGAGGSDTSAYRRDKYGDLRGYADDVVEILRELDLRDVIFVGHSVSAMIGLLASIKEPARFDRLVLVGPSPCYFNDGSYVGGFRREDLVAMLGQAENDFAAWARAMGPAIMGTPHRPALGQELADSFCRTDPKIATHFARVIFLSDNRADLARVTTPSLILQCSQDIVAPESVGRFMHAKMPGSELKILEAIGHCPHVSAPEETIEAVKTWLAAGRAQPLKRSA